MYKYRFMRLYSRILSPQCMIIVITVLYASEFVLRHVDTVEQVNFIKLSLSTSTLLSPVLSGPVQKFSREAAGADTRSLTD